MSKHNQQTIYPIHIMITLVLIAITVLFVGFSIAYLYNRVQSGQEPVNVPLLFYTNSIFLIGASYFINEAISAFDTDHTTKYLRSLWLTCLCSIIFIIFQIIAWNQLLSADITLQSGALSAYMYVISGMHFAHLLGGMPFIVMFIINARQRLKEDTSRLLYYSDDTKRRILKVIGIYWHFIDALWVYLLLFFLLNNLI